MEWKKEIKGQETEQFMENVLNRLEQRRNRPNSLQPDDDLVSTTKHMLVDLINVAEAELTELTALSPLMSK